MIKQIARSFCPFLLPFLLTPALLFPVLANTQESDTPAETSATPETNADATPAPLEPSVPRPTPLEQFASSFEQPEWIEAGSEKMLALYRPDTSGTPLGAALILHRGEQPPWWSNATEQMRMELSDYGWATLMILLPTEKMTIPARPKPKPPVQQENPEPKEDSEDQAAPGEDQEIFDSSTGELSTTEEMNKPEVAPVEAEDEIEPALPLPERNEQRIMAAMNYLNEKGQFNLALISDSTSTPIASATLLRMSPGNGAKAIVAQIIVNEPRDAPLPNKALDEGLFDPSVPLLDIYSDIHHYNSNGDNRQRRARQKKYQTYQQISIDLDDTQQLAKRVRGFLSKHAAGMEQPK